MGRPEDTIGLAGAINGVSSIHAAFFNAGGLGLLVGDGKLPNYGRNVKDRAAWRVVVKQPATSEEGAPPGSHIA
jgi:hypothetical protein